MTKKNAIYWFRQDLRLEDNPALLHAAEHDLLPIYILDDDSADEHRMGGASRWWLHHVLNSLNDQLDGKLQLYIGNPLDTLKQLIKQHQIEVVYWNRCYEPWRIKRDKAIKEHLVQNNVEVHSFNGSLLWEPWENLKADGSPYKVFTPFFKKGCLGAPPPRRPLEKPEIINFIANISSGASLSELNLLPKINWDKQLEPHWNISEKGAHQFLESFLENGLINYKNGRNFPALNSTSRLSPYLHFGQISPNQAWYAVHEKPLDENVVHFQSELGWREFSYSQLYHFPHLPRQNLQAKFDRFPWVKNDQGLLAWQKGLTGYPIVDAGMRELWQTGYMHNRVRMIVGSFLVKNLLIHWHEGEKWFWDCLVDADLANNSASWQWVAGCGADAAPYFRIFNPITQGQKFDPEGEYTKKYIPELNLLPAKYLYNPWEAPKEVLEKANVRLGETYPNPIVDIKSSREEALEAFAKLKEI